MQQSTQDSANIDNQTTCELGLKPPGPSGSKSSVWVWQGVLFVSAIFFASSSALAKVATELGASPAALTFFRFFIGWVLLLGYIGITRPTLRPRNIPVLLMRGVFNLTTVFLLYSSVKYTTITNANLLNLTYPAFVAILGPLILGESLSRRHWFALLGAAAGVYLVINPNFQQVNTGDLLGLGCGLAAGLAIMMLRRARQLNSTITVLLFLLTTGVVLSWPTILRENFQAYTSTTYLAVLGSGALGVLGQFAITAAFGHVSAIVGSLTSTCRVIIAAVIGVFCLGEILTWNVIIGSAILVGALLVLTGKEPRIKFGPTAISTKNS